jgi:beta-N-acetylhexosaminidase
MRAIGFALVRLMLAAALMPVALMWREPPLSDIRYQVLAGIVLMAVALAAIDAYAALRSKSRFGRARALNIAVIVVAAADVVLAGTLEAQFQWDRLEVLQAPSNELATLGRHIIVGFRSRAELHELVTRGAVAGVFVTVRNVRDIGPSNLAGELGSLQDMRPKDSPPLWIATDQEGGSISRLSPPLTALPTLSEVIARHSDRDERAKAVRDFAHTQGRELAAIGVNLNFAPVVDVDHHVIDPADQFTRIYQRAISTDPALVREVAGDYCAALMETGVRCTLKHFPGLGRVFGDTHKGSADLTAPVSELAATDWVPFRALMNDEGFTMLGHVRVTSVDAKRPASTSEPVVSDLLRRDWGYQGVLITDDFGMAAIYHSADGIEAAAVAALNAGVDLILVSYDPDQYYVVMHALLRAYHDGRLRRDRLQASEARLASAHAHSH